jgi:small subunit ribosomal protein S1
MKVLVVDKLGYCPGVLRSISLAEEAIASCEEGQVFGLGQLIHNEPEVDRLESLGLVTVDELKDIECGIVVVRAHGARPEVYEGIRDLGLDLVDGTCGVVRRAQQAARRLLDEGRTVVVYGDPDHPEVQGIMGAVGDRAIVVHDAADVARLEDLSGPVGVISQTTRGPEGFRAVVDALSEAVGPRNVKFVDTLCPHVTSRQIDTGLLAREVDAMVVVGGRNSSNTKSLAELCRRQGVPVHAIETAADLRPEWFEGVERVGVTAGVSTPVEVVEGVRLRLEEIASAARG